MKMFYYKLDSSGHIIREHEGIVPRAGWFPSKDKIDATKYRIVQGKLVEIPAPVAMMIYYI